MFYTVLLFSSFVLVSSTNCPDRWVAYQGSCYLFAHNAIDFANANAYCEQRQSNLVKIETVDENRFLLDFIADERNDHFWLGMTDNVTEGTWKWHDGDAVDFFDWAPTEPQDAGDHGEDCAVIVTQFGWADVSCVTSRVPLCELRVFEEIIG